MDTVVIYEGVDACQKCLGWKRIANDDEQSPWKYWAEIPSPSNLAVVLGIVRPIECPHCGGTGQEPVQPTTADATLVAEMSALRAELEAVKGREVAARGVVEAARLTAAGPDTTNYMRLVDALDAYDQATKE